MLMTACLCVLLKYIAASILHMHISIWGYTELITSRNVIYLALLMNTRKHPEQFACRSHSLMSAQLTRAENWLMIVRDNVIEDTR